MKPDVPAVLEHHAALLAARIVPQLTGFDANSVAMMSAMLSMVAEEWDRAAAWRVEENAAIRGLFRDALPVVAGTALADRIERLASETDGDLRLHSLDASNDRLRAALGELHAVIEPMTRKDAQQLDRAIWEELRRSVERRRVGLANF